LQELTKIDPITHCWLIGDENEYADMWYEGRNAGAHRISAHLFHGLDLNDKNQHALHGLHCQNKNCWNPEHLYVGTNSENQRDRYNRNPGSAINGNTFKTHCNKGHEFTFENTYVYENGKRRCRECAKLYMRKRYRK